MSKKLYITIAIGAIAFGFAGVVYAATATKYFQKIKQNTITGSVKVTTVKGDATTYEVVNQLGSWQEGDPVPTTSSANACVILRSNPGYDASACSVGGRTIKYYQKYTTTIAGTPTVNTDTDPPTFYAKTQYYLNGKKVSLPTAGMKSYYVKEVITHLYDDGHVVNTTSTTGAEAQPTAGTKTYTYKVVTLQPSN